MGRENVKLKPGIACIWQEQKGSIALFLLIILVALLLLAGLVVDASRILVAERKADLALQSAARSVLAACNPDLAGQFGLYGVDYVDKKAQLERYLFLNLVERHQGLTLVDYQIEKVDIAALPQETLLNNDAFEQQVLQYMKYKAPLRISENVVEKFRRGALSKKAQAGHAAAEAAQQGKAVRGKITALNKDLQRQGGSFQHWAGNKLEELQAMQQEVRQIQKELAAYQQLVEESSAKLNDVSQATGEKYSQLDVGSEVGQLQERIRSLEENLLANISLLEEIITLEEELDSLAGLEGDEAAHHRSALRSQIQSLAARWQPLGIIELPAVDYSRLSSKEVKKKAKMLQQLHNLYSASLADSPVRGSLIGREDFWAANREQPAVVPDNLAFADPEEDLVRMDLDNDLAEKAGLALFKLAGDFAAGVEQALLDGGAKLAICEYIMDKYTFATSRTERGHYFQRGEVEYILCGNDSELANVLEMFTKIFVIRWAIDALEAFLKSPVFHPVARLAEALTAGFVRACADMLRLYQGEVVALCPSMAQPALAYSDYLRLFLLQQDKNTQLERMRQLIQVNLAQSGQPFALKEHSTSIRARAEISINLWFLPALHLDKLGFPNFSGDRYYIVKEARAGY